MTATPRLQHRRPLWLAAMVSWLSMPVGYALFVVFGEFDQEDRSQVANVVLPAVAPILGYGLQISALGLLFGLPLVLWLRARGWLASIPVCIGAAAIGALAMHLFIWFKEDVGLDMTFFLLSAGFGASSGVIFSLVAGLRWGIRRL